MLYFSTMMLGAAVLVGDTQTRLASLTMMLSGTGFDVSSLSSRDKIFSVSGSAFEMFSEVGWMIGAAGAALLKRLQAIGLLIVVGISGEHVTGTALVGSHVFSAEELAAMTLECAAFVAASAGLMGLMRGQTA